jgi:carbonic anhydrase/acetyltransferase-like protein (isoleucine patch superfamily)
MPPLILPIHGKHPEIGPGCYVADNATLIGDVVLGADCTVWFTAVVRGDVNSIRIGERTNIQDGAVIHCTYERAATTIGSRVSIGHRAIVHGCTVEDDVLIGMGAIVMDGARIGSGSIIAAGAVVLEGTTVPSGTIWAGVPAKKVKDISPELLAGEVDRIAGAYKKYASWFQPGGDAGISAPDLDV